MIISQNIENADVAALNKMILSSPTIEQAIDILTQVSRNPGAFYAFEVAARNIKFIQNEQIQNIIFNYLNKNISSNPDGVKEVVKRLLDRPPEEIETLIDYDKLKQILLISAVSALASTVMVVLFIAKSGMLDSVPGLGG